MIYELKKFRTLGLSDMYEGLNQDFRIFIKNWRTIYMERIDLGTNPRNHNFYLFLPGNFLLLCDIYSFRCVQINLSILKVVTQQTLVGQKAWSTTQRNAFVHEWVSGCR